VEPLPVMTRDEIAVVESLADLPGLLSAADPADKADIYAGIGLRLTYQPEPRSVLAEVRFADQPRWRSESVRGGLNPNPNAP
jgi:site-specific DNA recombinase